MPGGGVCDQGVGEEGQAVGAGAGGAVVAGQEGAQVDAGGGVEGAAQGGDGRREAGLVGELPLRQQVLARRAGRAGEVAVRGVQAQA